MDMFSKKPAKASKPKRDPINRGEARQLAELERGETGSRIPGRTAPETREEQALRRARRRPRTSE